MSSLPFFPPKVFYCVNSGIYLRAVDIRPSAPFISCILRPPSCHSSLLRRSFHSVTTAPIKESTHHCSGACCSDTCEPCLLSCIRKVTSNLQSDEAPLILVRQKQSKTLFFSVLYSTQHRYRDKHACLDLKGASLNFWEKERRGGSRIMVGL